MKAVNPLTENEQITLKEAIANHPKNRVRTRAHAIFLSDKGYTILTLTDIFDAKFETVSSWIDHWGTSGIVGLYDATRIGRKPIYTETEVQRLKSLIDDEPHQLKRAQAILEEETGKKSSLDTLKRNIKKVATVTKGLGTH
ncbi:hypothetical protein PBPRB0869 [Photobacterium profundum SS9]|uniref:Transposase n=1 Tax=Photobacterium profundum (strain SS9) TaxID=298386 RepID=Q6LIY9_PHOPR|nr:hypothetical protein PBPRB0869 [Photobacterium profundum SS9]